MTAPTTPLDSAAVPGRRLPMLSTHRSNARATRQVRRSRIPVPVVVYQITPDGRALCKACGAVRGQPHAADCGTT